MVVNKTDPYIGINNEVIRLAKYNELPNTDNFITKDDIPNIDQILTPIYLPSVSCNIVMYKNSGSRQNRYGCVTPINYIINNINNRSPILICYKAKTITLEYTNFGSIENPYATLDGGYPSLPDNEYTSQSGKNYIYDIDTITQNNNKISIYKSDIGYNLLYNSINIYLYHGRVTGNNYTASISGTYTVDFIIYVI